MWVEKLKSRQNQNLKFYEKLFFNSMMISISLLTLGCSNDKESALVPNVSVKETATTEFWI
jgi:hypothetical protein